MGRFVEIPFFSIMKDGIWARREAWWLVGRLIYYTAEYDETIIVPNGFETDLASVPRLARLLIPKNDSHRAPAVVHDFLCRQAKSNADRDKADHIFLEAMTDVDNQIDSNWFMRGLHRIRRFAMFNAVHLAGKAKRFQ